jgi:alpha-L-rhamnosidase
MWERWDGVDADGVAHESLNHYAKGAVVSFLHRYVAGLDLPSDPSLGWPAYRRFRVRPRPGGGITWASVDLRVTVPPGTTAEVMLPDDSVRALGCGKHRLSI